MQQTPSEDWLPGWELLGGGKAGLTPPPRGLGPLQLKKFPGWGAKMRGGKWGTCDAGQAGGDGGEARQPALERKHGQRATGATGAGKTINNNK